MTGIKGRSRLMVLLVALGLLATGVVVGASFVFAAVQQTRETTSQERIDREPLVGLFPFVEQNSSHVQRP